MKKLIAFLMVMGMMAGSVTAQEEDICATLPSISYGQAVSGGIMNDSSLLGYCFDGASGDTIIVTLTATSGNLDTYVVLANTDLSEVFAENDDIAPGENTNSGFETTLPITGQYLLIATRKNFDEGDTTGDFQLTLELSRGSAPSGNNDNSGNSGSGLLPGTSNNQSGAGAGSGNGLLPGTGNNNAQPPSSNNNNNAQPAPTQPPVQPTEAAPVFDFPAVGNGVMGDTAPLTITCDTGERLNGGVEFSFINVNPGFPYTVTVVGLGELDPVLAVETRPGIGTCNDDAPTASGSIIQVPGLGEVTANNRTSQLTFTTPQRGFPTNITVGSFNGQPGRFVMVIEGFRIAPADELDGFSLRVPSSVALDALGVYMISLDNNLDPYMAMGAGPGLSQAYLTDGFEPDIIDYDNIFYPVLQCDDMGLRECDFTPSLPGGILSIKGGGNYVVGEFDAGMVVIPNWTDPMLYTFGSVNGASSGDYAIMVFGGVPDSTGN